MIFNSSSNLRMEWLSAEVDTPNCAAALVKLPACAAVRKCLSSFILFIVLPSIVEFYSRVKQMIGEEQSDLASVIHKFGGLIGGKAFNSAHV